MKHFTFRMRYLLLPYLITTGITIIGYSLLHWLALQAWEILPQNWFWVIFLPLFIVPITLVFWDGRAAKYLRNKNPSKSYYGLFFTLPLLPLMLFTQLALEESTGKLHILDNISQIDTTDLHRYYALKKSYVPYELDALHTTSHTKKGTTTFNGYLSVPIYDDVVFMPEDTTMMFLNGDFSYREFPELMAKAPKAWLALYYSSEMNSSLPDNEKDLLYHNFPDEVRKAYVEQPMDTFKYLERLGAGDKYDAFNEGIYTSREPLLFTPFYEPFEERGKQYWRYAVWSAAGGLLFVFCVMCLVALDEEKLYKMGVAA